MQMVYCCMFILLIACILSIVSYFFYMRAKRFQYPELNFSRFRDERIDIDAMEHLMNYAIRGVNGWMWLAASCLVLHCFLNFWSIVFMVINIVVVAYDLDPDGNMVLFLILGSLLLTCLDLWLDTKGRSTRYHKHWFDTSAITKDYIAEISMATSPERVKNLVIEFNNKVYGKNEEVTFP